MNNRLVHETIHRKIMTVSMLGSIISLGMFGFGMGLSNLFLLFILLGLFVGWLLGLFNVKLAKELISPGAAYFLAVVESVLLFFGTWALSWAIFSYY